jgi:hypothetical protein
MADLKQEKKAGRQSKGLVSTLAGEHGPWGAQEYFYIQPKRPLPYIAQIQPYHIVKCGLAAAGDLP